MKRLKPIVLFVLIFATGSFAYCDEGMWLPVFLKALNIETMQEKGLKLTAEDIYDINHSSLKDAIVQFGGGCTGEMVSPDGLLFTNHHCGYGYIQANSSVEHDYLSHGFWAKSREEELPNPGLTVKFLVRMEEVTAEVTKTIKPNMDLKARSAAMEKQIEAIKKKAVKGTHYVADVKPFYEGNEYYLLVYEIFKDVRLVGTPPNSIGKFGADADNWMWPRHTCDFSVFRVYADKEGKPAEYSKGNVPYRPKHFLPVSIDGVKQGDYAMIMGYPGSTNRYLSSYGVELLMNIQAPSIVEIRRAKLDIYEKYMNADPKVRIQYASKHARVANYWKYFIGQEKQLKENKVVEKKRKLETEFSEWAVDMQEYAGVIEDLKTAYAAIGGLEKLKWYTNEAILRGPEVITLALGMSELEKALQDQDKKAIKANTEKIRASLGTFFKDYHKDLDREIVTEMFGMFSQNIEESLQPKAFVEAVKAHHGDFSAMSQDLFDHTFMADQDKIEEFLAHPTLEALQQDAAFVWGKEFLSNYRSWMSTVKEATATLAKAKKLFVAGIRLMHPDKAYAPDANSTMRVTYGEVKDYAPADAIQYDYQTTLKGVMEKEDPDNPDFIVPARLKELYQNKDYGRYGKEQLVTCFLTTNDITGGNSGSPVLNAKGELIGLAFDGNWEAMSGDINYEPNLQRTIVVDIRYVLFIIEKYASASHLIEELQFGTK